MKERPDILTKWEFRGIVRFVCIIREQLVAGGAPLKGASVQQSHLTDDREQSTRDVGTRSCGRSLSIPLSSWPDAGSVRVPGVEETEKQASVTLLKDSCNSSQLLPPRIHRADVPPSLSAPSVSLPPPLSSGSVDPFITVHADGKLLKPTGRAAAAEPSLGGEQARTRT
ncbi:unnamed protein product [Pleuronectes platessa]|uniref:Uncharacterized protein n=1 Tax=Pleuronectes platessa TaxID=8262 RepID=A0A9N7VNF7_PLEPL|nr:unnamed protein product [Pleuronectes platessa]